MADTIVRTVELGVTICDAAIDGDTTIASLRPDHHRTGARPRNVREMETLRRNARLQKPHPIAHPVSGCAAASSPEHCMQSDTGRANKVVPTRPETNLQTGPLLHLTSSAYALPSVDEVVRFDVGNGGIVRFSNRF